MILGRPTNLWLSLTTAISGAIAATLVFLWADPTAVATLAGVWQAVVGEMILLVASPPPTYARGETLVVMTPSCSTSCTSVVAYPPAQFAPPMPQADAALCPPRSSSPPWSSTSSRSSGQRVRISLAGL